MADPLYFNYLAVSDTAGKSALRPMLPITLSYRGQAQEVMALVDSGADVNVLPYLLGIDLGLVWTEQSTTVALSGNFSKLRGARRCTGGGGGRVPAGAACVRVVKSGTHSRDFGTKQLLSRVRHRFLPLAECFSNLPQRRLRLRRSDALRIAILAGEKLKLLLLWFSRTDKWADFLDGGKRFVQG